MLTLTVEDERDRSHFSKKEGGKVANKNETYLINISKSVLHINQGSQSVDEYHVIQVTFPDFEQYLLGTFSNRPPPPMQTAGWSESFVTTT